MVSDADIVRSLASFLRKADLSTTTPGVVRKQLEQEFGVDLTERKVFIREQIDLYLENHQQEEEEEEQDGEVRDAGQREVGVEDIEDEDRDQEGEDDGEDQEEEERPARRSRQSESEPDSKRFRAKIDRAIKASLPKEKKKRAGGGLMKACGLSPELQAIIGETELPRTQVVKQLWVYIRENELQDPENKRKILCNDQLRGLFGVDSTDIFKMNKLLSRHIWPLDKAAAGDEDRKVKKQKTEKSACDRPKPDKKDAEKVKTEKKDSGRGRGTGLSPLSEKLIEFLGTEETEMVQHDVAKHIWDYIGEHKLQDVSDRRTIICDEKLRDLFGCDTFVGFDLTKLLAPHLKG